jgi:hypothetical protein
MGITVEGQQIPRWMFHVDLQREIQAETYDRGAAQFQGFAVRELEQYLVDGLDPLGRRIIDCAVGGGSVEDFDNLLPRA